MLQDEWGLIYHLLIYLVKFFFKVGFYMKLHLSSESSVSYSITKIKDVSGFRDTFLKYNQKRILMFVDSNVYEFYSDILNSIFIEAGIELTTRVIEVDEGIKSLSYVESVLDSINTFKPLRRSEPILVVGGGVLLDLVGFAASIFRRGIPYFRIPTTLLGMVDAGVGVKTGINFRGSKSRLGSFYPAKETFIYPAFLETLPAEDLLCGLAEILKISLVESVDLFVMLEANAKALLNSCWGYKNSEKVVSDNGNIIIYMAISLMLSALEQNLFESDLCRSVDFGHTWSSFFEFCEQDPLPHGLAVNIDMAISIILSINRGTLSKEDGYRVLSLMQEVGLPITHSSFYQGDELWGAFEDTVKHRDGMQNLPLLAGIGKCQFVNDLTGLEFKQAVSSLVNFVSKGEIMLCEHRRVPDTPMEHIVELVCMLQEKYKGDFLLDRLATLVKEHDQYILSSSLILDDELKELEVRSESINWKKLYQEKHTSFLLKKEMLSRSYLGKVLGFLSQLTRPKYILDLGLFTGFSLLSMLLNSSQVIKAVSCERERYLIKLFDEFVSSKPFFEKVDLREGDALATLNQLSEEGYQFDMIFIDIAKTDYVDVYELILSKKLLSTQGVLCIDNTLMKGGVYVAARQGEDVEAVKKFNAYVADDSRVRQVLLPIRDGVTLIQWSS